MGRCASCRAVFGPGKALWDPNQRRCVSACPEAVLVSTDYPAADEEDSTGWCQSCERAHYGYPVWDAEAGECVACPAEAPNYWDNSLSNARCVPACPEDAPFWSGTECWTCEQAWTGSLMYYLPSSGECVDECPEDAPVRAGTQICMTCEEAHPGENKIYWDQISGACV